jgi:hypothetical protein
MGTLVDTACLGSGNDARDGTSESLAIRGYTVPRQFTNSRILHDAMLNLHDGAPLRGFPLLAC